MLLAIIVPFIWSCSNVNHDRSNSISTLWKRNQFLKVIGYIYILGCIINLVTILFSNLILVGSTVSKWELCTCLITIGIVNIPNFKACRKTCDCLICLEFFGIIYLAIRYSSNSNRIFVLSIPLSNVCDISCNIKLCNICCLNNSCWTFCLPSHEYIVIPGRICDSRCLC